MIYKIDNVNIGTLSATPSNASGEKIALSGLFDLPKRKGTTEYDWGTSIEAFTDADDIILDGRTLTLNVAIKGSSVSDLHTKVDAFKADCIHCTKLYSELSGELNVIQKDDISVTEYAGNIALVKVSFWQEVYVPAAISIIPSSGNYMLDTYNLIKDFGIYISSLSEVNGAAKRIDIDTTLPYKTTSYRSAYDLTLKCKMSGQTLQELYSKMSQFNALCIKSGLRALKLPNNTDKKLYFKDGISVKVESDKNLSFDLKCRVIT